MKPLPLVILLMIMTCTFNTAGAQSIEEQMTKKHPNCNDVFLNAVTVLPKLYRQDAFDSMYTALHIWKQSCGNIPQIQNTYILLAMQQARFRLSSVDSTIIDLLVSYSHSFLVYQRHPNVYPESDKAYFGLISAWAKIVQARKPLSADEQFICKVFTGEITSPLKELKRNREKYTGLVTLADEKEAAQRSGIRSNIALLAGTWMPTGNLQIVGTHPAIGLQLGLRELRNQIDFTLQFRFLKSANIYTVQRSGSFYDSERFFGGYIGIDYTYFFASNQKAEVGLLGGMGYDGFDIFDSKYDNQNLKPLSIGSFNANAGLKFNFFLSPTFYLGLQGRFNYINYRNRGGSPMNGNAFSADLLIGGNNPR